MVNDLSKLNRYDKVLYIKDKTEIVMTEPTSDDQSQIIDDLRGSLLDLEPFDSKEDDSAVLQQESESYVDSSLATPKAPAKAIDEEH